MAGSWTALPIQPRRTCRDVLLARAPIHELSDFLPGDGPAAPPAHHPRPPRRAGRSANSGMMLRITTRDETEVIVPEDQQVVEI